MLPVRVLIIDDSEADRALVKAVLEKENGGFHMWVPASPAELFTLLERGDFDIVLSDLDALEVQGTQVLQTVKQRWPEVPFIIFTGTDAEERAAQALKLGAADYVLKTPYQIRHLAHTLHAALDQRRLQVEKQTAEFRLMESEARYRALFNHALDAILFVDEDGIVRSGNLAAQGFFPSQADHLEGSRIDSLLSFNEQHPPTPTWQVILQANGYQGELLLKNAETEVRYVELRVVVDILSGVHLAFLRDITQAYLDRERIHASLTRERQLRSVADTLRAVSNALNADLEPKVILSRLLELTEQVLTFDMGMMITVHQDRAEIVSLRGFEHHEEAQVINALHNQPIGAEAAEQIRTLVTRGQITIQHDVQKNPNWKNLFGIRHGQAWIGAPILINGSPAGLISLFSIKPGTFQQEHALVLEALANQTALALQNAELFENVRRGRERLQHLSNLLLELQEEERQALARELHDEIGQLLTGLKLLLASAAQSDGQLQQDRLADAISLVSDLLARVRQLSLELRPTMLDDLGLLPALLWQFDRFSKQTGITIDLQHGGITEKRFETKIETGAYRVIQEALTNIARHAGSAHAHVRVLVENSILAIAVSDEGQGFDVEQVLKERKSSGLLGIRERVHLLGGTLEIHSAAGKGTQIYVNLPLSGRLERRHNDRAAGFGG